MIIPNIWENKKWQPNHQPDKHWGNQGQKQSRCSVWTVPNLWERYWQTTSYRLGPDLLPRDLLERLARSCILSQLSLTEILTEGTSRLYPGISSSCPSRCFTQIFTKETCRSYPFDPFCISFSCSSQHCFGYAGTIYPCPTRCCPKRRGNGQGPAFSWLTH